MKIHGITLITLVVTIIVLLILAGISITMLTGENGVLSRAVQAQKATDVASTKDLSDVNKHNLRDYDNCRELIRTIWGTNDIVDDVKQLYLDEFEEARTEYNNKQTREDRKIKDYFKKVCESQNDIACEIIIELGDMDF